MPSTESAVVPRGIPKIELHLHLDGCLSFTAVRSLRPQTTLSEYRSEFVAPAKCTNLADFLARTVRMVALLQSEAALRLAVDDLFDQLQRDSVAYAELRFAPLLHLADGLRDHDVVRIVEDQTRSAIDATGVEATLILCTLRHFSADESLRTARLCAEFSGTLVCALDIAGDEAGFGLDAHEAAFRFAARHGVHRTAHAGEALGAASVSETLERLRPQRIGHGIRSIEDPDLVERLATRDVHLEVCPSSNVQTGVVETLADHPIDRLRRAGVSLGVSTDTRAIGDVTLDREYERLHAQFGWDDEVLRTCNRAGLDAAFAPESLKTRLRRTLGA